jgi:hypothetical protein
MTEFTIKKNQTLGELSHLICDFYGLKNIELQNFRLRLYDPKLKVKMGVHDQHSVQLNKLNFMNYLDLTPEIKNSPEDVFEAYNANSGFLRVLKYVEGEVFDVRQVDKMQWQVVQVDKKVETVAGLEERISAMFDIPVEKLVILLRHEHIYNNTVRTELYNMDWRKPKTLDEASRLDHGQLLYVDEGDPKAGKLDTYRWH